MFNNNWDIILDEIINDDKFVDFNNYIFNEYKIKTIYPKKEDLYKSLEYTDYNDTKVVIIGQDPYHQKGQANGLAFSVNPGVKLPPSLRNIFNEIQRDIGIKNTSGDLTHWAKQGVLLLNTVLTVEESKPRTYSNTYWNFFTDAIIRAISKKKNVIFLLWGADAIKKTSLIEEGNYILSTSHPSPLSSYRGFNGCGHFSQTNEILRSLNKEIIDWSTN